MIIRRLAPTAPWRTAQLHATFASQVCGWCSSLCHKGRLRAVTWIYTVSGTLKRYVVPPNRQDCTDGGHLIRPRFLRLFVRLPVSFQACDTCPRVSTVSFGSSLIASSKPGGLRINSSSLPAPCTQFANSSTVKSYFSRMNCCTYCGSTARAIMAVIISSNLISLSDIANYELGMGFV